MIKRNKGIILLTSLIILLPLLVGLLLWDVLPDSMATHWNASGEVDGWGSKVFVVFFLPLFLLGTHWFCIIVTAADPKSKDIDKKPLMLVLWICPFMSLLICSLVYAISLGVPLSVEILMPLLLGAMFLIIGNYLPKCKRNYTIGIKVSWALEDEENWNATHRFAGKLWVIGGAVIMATAILGNFISFLTITLTMAFAPMIYSYLYYKKHKKGEHNENSK